MPRTLCCSLSTWAEWEKDVLNKDWLVCILKGSPTCKWPGGGEKNSWRLHWASSRSSIFLSTCPLRGMEHHSLEHKMRCASNSDRALIGILNQFYAWGLKYWQMMFCSFGLLRNCSSDPARIWSSALHWLSYFSTKMGRSKMLEFCSVLFPVAAVSAPIVHYASACCKNEEGCCVLNNKAPNWLQEWERKECKCSLSSLLPKRAVWQWWLLMYLLCPVSAHFGAAAVNVSNLSFIPKKRGQMACLF